MAAERRRRARRRAAIATRAACPSCRRRSAACSPATGRRRRPRVAGHPRLRPLARARVAVLRRAQRADLGRHAAAAASAPTSACGRPIPTAIRSARFLRLARRVRARCRRDTLVLPSHGLPFRGIAAARRAAARAPCRAARRARDALAAAARRVSPRELVPVLFRRPLDLQQRFFAMGEAIAHLNHLWHAARVARTRATDGALRFAA